ncbi:hypothetical protein DFH07DRAFT_784899 [Mycena maculata]|uniref:Uncharacterized protein n=1 Tax=Mycena maculata TaxID=230809 RepID=A0AAD7HEA3_9AGAR|nr:hypothetical protein DFH07DRAFT_784899 [Mycena maculata]
MDNCGRGPFGGPEEKGRRARGSGGVGTNPRKACKHVNVTGSVGTSAESPRKKTSRFGRTEQHDGGAGKVPQKGGPERSGCVRDAGNGREWNVDMPENAEDGKDCKDNAEITDWSGKAE